VFDADGGRGAPGRGLGQVPLAERVEGRADLRQPAEVACGRLGAGDGHGGHRLEDQALTADVALRGDVGGPQRVLGVGAGSFDQGGEHPVIDALRGGQAGRADLADLAADGREVLRGALAGLPARVAGQPVEFIDAEQGGVVRVVAVLGGEIRLAEPRDLGRGRGRGAGHVLSRPAAVPADMLAREAR
jgi:hypothetical protein